MVKFNSPPEFSILYSTTVAYSPLYLHPLLCLLAANALRPHSDRHQVHHRHGQIRESFFGVREGRPFDPLLALEQSAMLNLLLTVVVTIIRGIPLMMVLAIVVICYSLVGVILFSGLRTGEALDLKYVQ